MVPSGTTLTTLQSTSRTVTSKGRKVTASASTPPRSRRVPGSQIAGCESLSSSLGHPQGWMAEEFEGTLDAGVAMEQRLDWVRALRLYESMLRRLEVEASGDASWEARRASGVIPA